VCAGKDARDFFEGMKMEGRERRREGGRREWK